MPFTHVEIEERKSQQIAWLFAALVLLYAVSTLALVWIVKGYVVFSRPSRLLSSFSFAPTPVEFGEVFLVSLIAGILHWGYSTRRLLDRSLEAMAASPADPQDTYHAKFTNVVQEVSVALGGRPIEPHVIPTTAANACAVSDFAGRAAIAITEGALALLSREQLEAVVGHEAAHIARGDSVTSSALCGLFALHEEALKGLSRLTDADEDQPMRFGNRRVPAIVLIVIVVLWITRGMKKLCEVIISREEEYRADAVSVRLTRDPLALAEALRLISERWHGVGMRGESLASLFIVHPDANALSEQDGLFADLFSTHPPTARRIALLLGMAHMDAAQFDELMEHRSLTPLQPTIPSETPAPAETTTQWMLFRDGQWSGPLGLQALEQCADLMPDSWVRRMDETGAKPANRDPQLLTLLRQRYSASGDSPLEMECPVCRVPLVSVLYEGAPINTCPACHGCYVDESTMAKVFARQEYDFPESIKRLGDMLLSTEGQAEARRKLQVQLGSSKHRDCPRCRSSVVRKFYTEVYPVEVDQCWQCGLTWLDAQALELLQYLYEKRRVLGNPFNKE